MDQSDILSSGFVIFVLATIGVTIAALWNAYRKHPFTCSGYQRSIFLYISGALVCGLFALIALSGLTVAFILRGENGLSTILFTPVFFFIGVETYLYFWGKIGHE